MVLPRVNCALLAFVCVFPMAGGAFGQSISPSDREMVLKEGDTVTVFPLPNKQVLYPRGGDIPFNGPLTVRAGSGFLRYYKWDGETRWVNMEPRQYRWMGAFGAFWGGLGSHWQSNHGITRGVLEEAQMDFDTVDDAQKWLASRHYTVYTHDGVAVTFSKSSGAGGTLSVGVWQVLVRKQRPVNLKGSHDELITVTRKP